MPKLFFVILSLFVLVFVSTISSVPAQPGVFSKEDVIRFTPQWKGDRLPDGRPNVSDELLVRMKNVNMEDAWSVLRRYGFVNQFEAGWVKSHEHPKLVGRALTAAFIPLRPDVNEAINAEGKRNGETGAQNSWVIGKLRKGDVLVVDLFGKVIEGTFAGNNLSTMIKDKTGNGYIVNGGCRDLESVLLVPDCPVYNRGWDPSFLDNVMLMGINIPIRTGRAVVMPGDIVLGGSEGVLFIPAHLAEESVVTSEIITLRDEFGQLRMKQGAYTAGQIDNRWTPEIEKDFDTWLKSEKKYILTEEQKQKYLGGRTW
jgi:regulator of RNase E activity RraA